MVDIRVYPWALLGAVAGNSIFNEPYNASGNGESVQQLVEWYPSPAQCCNIRTPVHGPLNVLSSPPLPVSAIWDFSLP